MQCLAPTRGPTATTEDSEAMHRVEQAARAMLKSHGVDLDGLDVLVGLDEVTSWDLALVAEVDGRVVGAARSAS